MNDFKKYRFHDFVETMSGLISGKTDGSDRNVKKKLIKESVWSIDIEGFSGSVGRCASFLNSVINNPSNSDITTENKENLYNIVFSYEVIQRASVAFLKFSDFVIEIFSSRNFPETYYETMKSIFMEFDNSKFAKGMKVKGITAGDYDLYVSEDLENFSRALFPYNQKKQEEFVRKTVSGMNDFLVGMRYIMSEFKNAIDETYELSGFGSIEFQDRVKSVLGNYNLLGKSLTSNLDRGDEAYVIDRAIKVLNSFWAILLGLMRMDDPNDSSRNDESEDDEPVQETPPEESEDEVSMNPYTKQVDISSVSHGLTELAKHLPKRNIRDFNAGAFGEINDCVGMLKGIYLHTTNDI